MRDSNYFLGLLRRLLPRSWFPDDSPTLVGILSGFASTWSKLWELLEFTRQQSRLATATGRFLTLAAFDFLGRRISRRPGEGDESFRRRVVAEILRLKATRPALRQALIGLTGHAPRIFEPANTGDTGGYGIRIGRAYGRGRYGSTRLPYQAFVEVYRPTRLQGSARGLSGWRGTASGYRAGRFAYATPAGLSASSSDAEIYALVASITPAATITWVRIVDLPPFSGDRLDDNFVLDESELSSG